MKLDIKLFARTEVFETWLSELKSIISKMTANEFRLLGKQNEPGQIVFVDARLHDLKNFLSELDRRGKAVFLVVNENEQVQAPEEWLEDQVDDVLVYPFRALEVLGKLKQYQQILKWDEVARLNTSFHEVIERLREDLQLAERLQKGRLPARFPPIRGMQVVHRYLAGMKPGGDYFDVVEGTQGKQVSIVLSDSSSYGLSTAVLSTLMKVVMKLSKDQNRSARETVQQIHHELLATLGERDRLSLFYGVISRQDLVLRYTNLGTTTIFHAASGRDFQELPGDSAPLTQGSSMSAGQDQTTQLQPNDRLVLVSDGFLNSMGGKKEAEKLLNQFRNKEGTDLLNELSFQVKSKFAEPDDLPEEDCSGIVIDIDSKILRLAN